MQKSAQQVVLTRAEAKALAQVLEHSGQLVDMLDADKLKRAEEDNLVEVKLLDALLLCQDLGITPRELEE